jgi:hypothetical protein
MMKPHENRVSLMGAIGSRVGMVERQKKCQCRQAADWIANLAGELLLGRGNEISIGKSSRHFRESCRVGCAEYGQAIEQRVQKMHMRTFRSSSKWNWLRMRH